MRIFLLIIFFVVIIWKYNYSQKIQLPIDSAKKVNYQKTIVVNGIDRNDLFNIIIQWVHSDLKRDYPIIKKDTILFSNQVPAYSTEYGGFTHVGTINCNTTIILSDTNVKISITDFSYFDFESKLTKSIEDMYFNNVMPEKWLCFTNVDEFSTKLIEQCERLMWKGEGKIENNNFKLDKNSMGYELMKGTKQFNIGCTLTIVGATLSIIAFSESSSIFFLGAGSTIVGVILTIKGNLHLRKAAYLLNKHSHNQKTCLRIKVGFNNIGLVYNF